MLYRANSPYPGSSTVEAAMSNLKLERYADRIRIRRHKVPDVGYEVAIVEQRCQEAGARVSLNKTDTSYWVDIYGSSETLDKIEAYGHLKLINTSNPLTCE